MGGTRRSQGRREMRSGPGGAPRTSSMRCPPMFGQRSVRSAGRHFSAPVRERSWSDTYRSLGPGNDGSLTVLQFLNLHTDRLSIFLGTFRGSRVPWRCRIGSYCIISLLYDHFSQVRFNQNSIVSHLSWVVQSMRMEVA